MAKTITYGIMHLVVAFAVSYALTRNIAIAGSIALIEPFVQTFAYYFHEKFWEKRKTKQIFLRLYLHIFRKYVFGFQPAP